MRCARHAMLLPRRWTLPFPTTDGHALERDWRRRGLVNERPQPELELYECPDLVRVISAPCGVTLEQGTDNRFAKQTALGACGIQQQIAGNTAQFAAEPGVDRYTKTLLAPVDDLI